MFDKILETFGSDGGEMSPATMLEKLEKLGDFLPALHSYHSSLKENGILLPGETRVVYLADLNKHDEVMLKQVVMHPREMEGEKVVTLRQLNEWNITHLFREYKAEKAEEENGE